MAEKQENSDKPPSTNEKPKEKLEGASLEEMKSGGGEELEGAATGKPVVVNNKKKIKTKKRKGVNRLRKSRRSDVPDCKTVEKNSAKSHNSEKSQDDWLNDLVKDAPKTPWGHFVSFIDDYKYPIIGGLALGGLLFYFALKKNVKKCLFTGKTKF